MRFGCCASVDQLRLVERAGYDFIELVAADIKPLESEAAFSEVARRVAASRMRPEAWNRLVPPDLKVVGPDVDDCRVDAYLATVLRRIARLGGEVVVFGSGPARSAPPGWPAEKVHAQLHEFLSACADYADRYDLIIAIEPLCKAESNVINSYREAVAYAEDCKHPRIQAMADLFHLREEGESFDHIRDDGVWLAHAHVAGAGRAAPNLDATGLDNFLAALADVGYDQRLTLECQWSAAGGEVAAALEAVKQRWAATVG